jgi:hypothetical protein
MNDLSINTTASLGIRNNNPGNLRYDGTNWKGSIGSASGFVKFSSVEYGIRAMAKVIANNINGGNDTIEKYITRYAPPSENDTTSYINYVAKNSGYSSNQTLNDNPVTLFKLIKAQIKVENGNSANFVTDKMITDGINLLTGGSFTAPVNIVGVILLVTLIGTMYFLSTKH